MRPKPSKYDPRNWYWAVSGNPSQIYSSAAAAYVSTSDGTYLAWVAAGNMARTIDSEASLWAVLGEQFPGGIAGGNTAGKSAAHGHKVDMLPDTVQQILINHEKRIQAREGNTINDSQAKTALGAILSS